MSSIKPFNCWNCGACCKILNFCEELKHFDRGDGTCIHLQSDNTCGIYDSRPDICNNRVMYDKDLKDKMTWDEFLDIAEETCKTLDSLINKKE